MNAQRASRSDAAWSRGVVVGEVSGVDLSDFQLVLTGLTGASIVDVTGSTTAYVDDVHIGPADDPAVNWVANGGFEETDAGGKPPLAELLEHARRHMAGHVRGIRQGNFAVLPRLCSNWCDFRGVCRHSVYRMARKAGS